MSYRLTSGAGLLLFCATSCLLAGEPRFFAFKGVEKWGLFESAAQVPDEDLFCGDECLDPDCGDCGKSSACGKGGCGAHGDGCHSCSMPQHHMYFPESHGYYYFRPYNHNHIRRHQDAVTRWGGDSRNPYDNTIFEAMYVETGEVVTERVVTEEPSESVEETTDEAPLPPTPPEIMVEGPSLQQPITPVDPEPTLAEDEVPIQPLQEPPMETGNEPTPAIIPPPAFGEEAAPLQESQEPLVEPADQEDPFAPDGDSEPTTSATSRTPAVGLALMLMLPGAKAKKESKAFEVRQISARSFWAHIHD